MTDRPILFSAPMVRALLAGTKTQTRRAIPEAMQESYSNYDDWCSNVSAGVPTSRQWEREFYLERIRIQPGDRLWCRENHAICPRTAWALPKTVSPDDADFAAYYQADFDRSGKPRWKPSIHMPRWASRLTLYVTDVRVERLKDISEDDARAEGVVQRPDGWFTVIDVQRGMTGAATHAVDSYAMLWESINGLGSWTQNPWVAAYTFVPVLGNIDTLPATLEPAGDSDA
ncbi:hypothetical protein EZH22_24670 [Xanthobacter dioxanivorans]|uniref:Uncharacterized protein n=1 Tax=Xanthobacter dioxanivorans TaxID=2528964 RepID=A0A974SIF7_9HYPH|nr:hypothetical protein [Xanthobacter dioxanivorans]QRG06144.1 hypothetical protein EZH22_24670 [Xanthobacter dioxanivorans]